MKGRNQFTADGIGQLTVHIRKKLSAPPEEQKHWRNKMRELGFYISDFHGGGGAFAEDDLSRLIQRGVIEVVDKPGSGEADARIREEENQRRQGEAEARRRTEEKRCQEEADAQREMQRVADGQALKEDVSIATATRWSSTTTRFLR